MKRFEKLPLRARLFLAMGAVMLMLVVISSTSFYVIEQHLERREVGEYLRQEAGRLSALSVEERRMAVPSALVLYVEADAPRELTTLDAGLHDVLIDSRDHFVLVADEPGQRIYLTMPESDIERLEQRAMVAFVVWVILLTAAALWVAYRVSARLVEPITRLARRVEDLNPDERQVRLTPDFRGEEVERIAGAMDRYLERLEGFVERERSFTSTASHELRTPLAVISGAAEVLAGSNDMLNATHSNAVERIQRATAEMHQFIDALLALARQEEFGEFRAECDVSSVLKRICEDARDRLPEHLSLSCDSADSAYIAAPSSLVHIVLSNLVANATRHARSRISVECRADRVIVEDDGPGIPAEILARAFERHFSGSGGGAGIGLYLVKRICDQYGWKVSLENSADNGARATVCFLNTTP